MKTIRIKGSAGLNDWFAEQLVKEHGPNGARALVCGPALAAVERVIAAMSPVASPTLNTEKQ